MLGQCLPCSQAQGVLGLFWLLIYLAGGAHIIGRIIRQPDRDTIHIQARRQDFDQGQSATQNDEGNIVLQIHTSSGLSPRNLNGENLNARTAQHNAPIVFDQQQQQDQDDDELTDQLQEDQKSERANQGKNAKADIDFVCKGKQNGAYGDVRLKCAEHYFICHNGETEKVLCDFGQVYDSIVDDCMPELLSRECQTVKQTRLVLSSNTLTNTSTVSDEMQVSLALLTKSNQAAAASEKSTNENASDYHYDVSIAAQTANRKDVAFNISEQRNDELETAVPQWLQHQAQTNQSPTRFDAVVDPIAASPTLTSAELKFGKHSESLSPFPGATTILLKLPPPSQSRQQVAVMKLNNTAIKEKHLAQRPSTASSPAVKTGSLAAHSRNASTINKLASIPSYKAVIADRPHIINHNALVLSSLPKSNLVSALPNEKAILPSPAATPFSRISSFPKVPPIVRPPPQRPKLVPTVKLPYALPMLRGSLLPVATRSTKPTFRPSPPVNGRMDIGRPVAASSTTTALLCDPLLPTTTTMAAQRPGIPNFAENALKVPTLYCGDKPDGSYPDPHFHCAPYFFVCSKGATSLMLCFPGDNLIYDKIAKRCRRRFDVDGCSILSPVWPPQSRAKAKVIAKSGRRHSSAKATSIYVPVLSSIQQTAEKLLQMLAMPSQDSDKTSPFPDCKQLRNGYYTPPVNGRHTQASKWTACSSTYYYCSEGLRFKGSCRANEVFVVGKDACRRLEHVPVCSRRRYQKRANNKAHARALTNNKLRQQAANFSCDGKPNGNYVDPAYPCAGHYFVCRNRIRYKMECAPGGRFVYVPSVNKCVRRSQVSFCAADRPNPATPTFARNVTSILQPDAVKIPPSVDKHTFQALRSRNASADLLSAGLSMPAMIDQGSAHRTATPNPSIRTTAQRSMISQATQRIAFSCRGRPDGHYEMPNTTCSNDYIECRGMIRYLHKCTPMEDQAFVPARSRCVAKKHVLACRTSFLPSNRFGTQNSNYVNSGRDRIRTTTTASNYLFLSATKRTSQHSQRLPPCPPALTTLPPRIVINKRIVNVLYLDNRQIPFHTQGG